MIRPLFGIAIHKTAQEESCSKCKAHLPSSKKVGILFADGYDDYKEVRLLVKQIDGLFISDAAAGVIVFYSLSGGLRQAPNLPTRKVLSTLGQQLEL